MSRNTEPCIGHAPSIYQLRLRPDAQPIAATSDQSVMQCAMQAGFEMRASCRNGTCRTCMCRMLSGEVNYAIVWPGLTAEEKAEGYVLPCVARPTSNVVLEQTQARAT